MSGSEYSRVYEVLAVQYTGQDYDKLTEVFKETKPNLKHNRLYNDDGSFNAKIDQTDWLVLEKGEFDVYTDSNFKKYFKKVLQRKDAS